MKYDFSGWATRHNVRCSDGRTIMSNAFADDDGKVVPLVWNHQHNSPDAVVGKALLRNAPQGVYAYGSFNDTEQGQYAKELVMHGDITSLSICANKLKQNGRDVMHGTIREVSLVLAGANPEAFIDVVMTHGEEEETTAYIYMNGDLHLEHGELTEKPETEETEEKEDDVVIEHAEEQKEMANEATNQNDKTIKDVVDSMTEEQKQVLYFLVGKAAEDGGKGDNENVEHSDMEDEYGMNYNVFEGADDQYTVITHADQMEILENAKRSSVGTFRNALENFAGSLQHGVEDIETLFPEYKDVRPGAPEFIKRDLGWVTSVMNGVKKSPFSRIRTRNADIRGENLRAKGYQKGNKKTVSGDIKLLSRTTDPQTVYRKDALHRDDIIDITEFDVVQWQYGVMKENLEEDIALAIMIGDDRLDSDPDKIFPEHIRPIWQDKDLYTIHVDVDFATAATELQGTNTSANFSENYIKAEEIIKQTLYARENYKGTGKPDMYCTPHLVNIMLLARDLNGRRIYENVNDLAAALNVGTIHTAEQFEGKVREAAGGKKKELLALFVNLDDYTVGSTKGGEITRFNQFDIDFNQEKYLIETRLSGALTRPYAAIALEIDVTNAAA